MLQTARSAPARSGTALGEVDRERRKRDDEWEGARQWIGHRMAGSMAGLEVEVAAQPLDARRQFVAAVWAGRYAFGLRAVEVRTQRSHHAIGAFRRFTFATLAHDRRVRQLNRTSSARRSGDFGKCARRRLDTLDCKKRGSRRDRSRSRPRRGSAPSFAASACSRQTKRPSVRINSQTCSIPHFGLSKPKPATSTINRNLR